MKIAIASPTGHIGHRIVQNIQNQGAHQLVLLARNPKKLEQEQKKGATVKQGDLNNASFVTEALKGVDALFWLIPPDFGNPDVIEYYKKSTQIARNAIQTNHVKRVVFLSSVGAHLPDKTGPIKGLHHGEKILGQAEADITFLRPNYFFENFLSHIPTLQQANAFFLPVPGSTSFAGIATQDIGDEAAKILTDSRWKGIQAIELDGPSSITFDGVASTIGKAIGKPITFIQVTSDQAKEAMLKMGMGKSFVNEINELHDSLGQGLIQHQPGAGVITTSTTFEQFVQKTLAPALKAASPVTA